MKKEKTKKDTSEWKDFADLVGETANLYQCNDANCFKLSSIIFEVVEDENDGYRSSMDKVKIVCMKAPVTEFIEDVIIEKAPNDLIGEYSEGFEGYALRGVGSKHLWYVFGTDLGDGYYPSFVFRFNPLPSNKDIKRLIKD